MRTIEDGKPMLVAKVVTAGRPDAGVTVVFSVTRTFGAIELGKDTTLDDGTAAVPFPDKLPGGADGMLKIRATLTAPDAVQGQQATALMPAAKPAAPPADKGYPRALWAPHAPFPLIVSLLVLLGGVWLTYAIVVVHIVRIARDVHHA